MNSDLQPILHRAKSAYEGFDLKFKDLIIWVPEHKRFRKVFPKKAIIKGISGHIKPGTMTAIIGPSGSGKTTLMNFLSGRQNSSQQFQTYCEYFIDDTKIESVNEFKNIIGYVLQDDIMDTRMTPRQLFEFYAKFRGRKDFKEKAQEVIEEMGLEKCANTVVGGLFVRGISGGERKRTSIGIELISEPNLLFLDEPTTGLDSTTALEIMKNIADLRDRGITVISTIHQPSDEIMAHFDKVLILCDGHIIYDGSPLQIKDHLTRMGFENPAFETPIEYFMKIIDKDDIRVKLIKETGEAKEEVVTKIHAERIEMFIEDAKRAAEEKEQSQDPRNRVESNIGQLRSLALRKNQNINPLRQLRIFLTVYFRLFFQDFFGIIIKSILFWVTFVVLLLVFVKMPSIEEDPRAAMQNKAGFYFMFMINMIFAGNNATSTLFLPQKLIYLKDRQSRMYGKFAFFWSNSVDIIPYYIVNITIAVIIYFYVLGLNNDSSENLAWIWAFFFFAVWMAGASFGLIISMIVDHIEQSGPLAPLLILPQIIVAGFFANIKTITWPLFIYSFISVPRFAFQGLILTEFRNADQYRLNCKIKTPCPNDTSKTCTIAVPPSQADICDPRKVFDFYETDVWVNFIAAMVIMIGFRVIAYLIFLRKYREVQTNYGFDQELFDLYCKPQIQDQSPLKPAENSEKIVEINVIKQK